MIGKFASYMDCVSYRCRMTPFFDTLQEVEDYIKRNNVTDENCYIKRTSNWQAVINGRNDYNTDDSVPLGS